MATFTPLTKEQYQKAIDAGFSPEKIVQFEQKRRQSMGGSTTSSASAPATKSGGIFSKVGGFLKNVGIGVEKGAGSTAIGLGQVALKGASLIPGFKDTANAAIQTGEDIKKQQFTAETPGQVVGKTGEQIGEMFIPVGLEEKVATKLAEIPELAKNAPLMAKITQGLLKTGVKAGASAAEFGAKTYLQTGGNTKQALEAGALAGAIEPIAGAAKAIGKGVAEAIIPTSAREAKLLQAYKANVPFWERVMAGISGTAKGPTTAGKTAFEKGFMGTESMIGVQAKRGANNLWDGLIKPALDKSTTKVDMEEFWNQARTQIVKENPELARQKDLLNALDSLKEDYAGVKSISMKQLQKFKEGWAKFIPEKVYRGKPIAGAFNDVKDIISGISRTTIYNDLGPEVKQAYFDYGNLKGLQELGQKAMTGGKLKGGFGSFWSAIKDMGLVPLGTVGGQTIYKLGNVLELVGKQGAKTVTDIFQ